jgi:hypothetical protein
MPLPKRIDEDDETIERPTPTASPFHGFAEATAAAFHLMVDIVFAGFNVPAAASLKAKGDPASPQEEFRIGEFYADYSLLTPEEITASDPDADALFQRSKPISR